MGRRGVKEKRKGGGEGKMRVKERGRAGERREEGRRGEEGGEGWRGG